MKYAIEVRVGTTWQVYGQYADIVRAREKMCSNELLDVVRRIVAL